MSDVLQIKRPAAGQTLTYLVLSDVHSFYYNKSVFKKSLKILKQVPEKQRRVILLGDILDCEYLHASHPVFNKAVKEKLYEEHFLLEFENEVAWFEEFLADIVEVTGTYKSIYFSEGNHEQRLRRSNFIDNCSHSLRANFDLFRNLGLKKRGIPYIKYNDFYIKLDFIFSCYIEHKVLFVFTKTNVKYYGYIIFRAFR